MAKRNRPLPIARTDVQKLTLGLRATPRDRWPNLLQRAGDILASKGLSDSDTRDVLSKSLAAASKCAIALGRRHQFLVQEAIRVRLKKNLIRISNCSKRVPAEVRHSLDKTLVRLAMQRPVDLEVLFQIFDHAQRRFTGLNGQSAAARTALAAMRISKEEGRNVFGLKDDVEALPAELLGTLNETLEKHPRKHAATASTIFQVLASALQKSGVGPDDSEIKAVFVKQVGDLWRSYGLRPSRIMTETGVSRSPFHRFLDLVLTALTEPHSRRHASDLDQQKRLSQDNWISLSPHQKEHISGVLRRSDLQWLITDHDVKKKST
jgi:hypothetical protein